MPATLQQGQRGVSRRVRVGCIACMLAMKELGDGGGVCCRRVCIQRWATRRRMPSTCCAPPAAAELRRRAASPCLEQARPAVAEGSQPPSDTAQHIVTSASRVRLIPSSHVTTSASQPSPSHTPPLSCLPSLDIGQLRCVSDLHPSRRCRRASCRPHSSRVMLRT